MYRRILSEKKQLEITREQGSGDDFKKAIDKLREFIKSSFLLEDILDI
jgi:hypothetical protein